MKPIHYPILNFLLGAWIVFAGVFFPGIRFASAVAAIIAIINLVHLRVHLQGDVSEKSEKED